ATSTNSNTAKSLDPRTNDSDPESGALTIVSVTTPSSGTAVVTGGGTGVTYTPAANFIGTATFNYTIRDPENATATATVTVAVNNQGPVAANDTTSTNSNTAKSLDPRTNDSDPEGGALTIVSLTTPSSGSAVVTGGGTGVTYTPAANFIGTATFSYTVRDPQNATATATVTVTVNNQGPVAVNDATSTNSNTAKSLDPRTNDSDPEGGALTIVSVTTPSSGSAIVTGGGTGVTYTPAANFIGTATFSYTVRDPQNATATATVTVTVNNQAPVAVNDATSTNSNTAKAFNPRTNDSDPEGGALTIVSVTTPSSGSAVVTGGGTGVTYTPAANFIGTATFNYTVRDPQNATATATVTVTVNNQVPVAGNDATSTNSNTAKSLDPRTNDSDPEGGALTIVSVTTPSSGSAVVTGGGTGVTYTPAANFIGTATFSYSVRDPQNATATATVTVTVNNQAPVAQPDSVSTAYNTAVNFNPRTNDSDPESGALTIVSATTPSSGTATVISGTSITYTPASNFSGTATFNYTIRDPQNATASSTVTVTVAPAPNQPPVAVNDSVEGFAYTNEVIYLDVPWAANDSDPNGDPLTVTSVTQPTKGSVAIQGNSIVYTSATNNILASFTYTISDGRGGQSTATVQIHITRESPN
ncbi:MAG: tandem-95 repeat protein, partial [Alphaproteobacteria bacterium]|nr:tandem-95 repeat protein [Alphaproteobacteria bacterium]